MKIAFTQEQQAVIDHRNGNLLVSAAAGSGKTAVLVERIVQMILDPENPVPVDRILVVTFTNAAARQMKEKIEQRIQEACLQKPEDWFLQEQYHNMAMAGITTLHAFCLRVLEDYITRIPGLDPGFRVADETETALLQADVLAQVLECCYTRALAPQLTQESTDFLAFMDAYGGARQDSQVQERLLTVYRFMESDPNPLQWLARAVEHLNPESWEAPEGFGALADERLQRNQEQGLAAYAKLAQLMQEALEGAESKQAAKGGKLLAALEQVVDPLEQAEGAALARECTGLVWPRISYDWFKNDPEADREARGLVMQMKAAFERCANLYVSFYAPEAKEKQRLYVLPAMRGMKAILQEFDAAYRAAKQEKNIAEFSDFEHYALQILQDEGAAADLREQFRYIYIDEYQDSNPLQEAIIERIARKNAAGQACNVFMVGDVKQSIYRFRQADPSLFLDKYEHYGQKPDTSVLMLRKNFRSEAPVLDAVNDVFEALMQEESAEMVYSEDQRLYLGRSLEEAVEQAELHVLEVPDGMDSLARSEAEAAMVAERVGELLAEGYEMRDIVILLRSVAMRGDIFRKALEARGIAAYAEASESFYDTQEIRTILNLLHVIDNPRQDIPLMGVLYSPIGEMNEEELAQIRLAAPESDFYDALQAVQEQASPLAKKVAAFLARLRQWREAAGYRTVHDLLWQLYTETGYYLYASSMPGGALRKANLDMLLEKSIAFEKGIYSGLYQFLRYVEKMDKNRKTQEEAKILGEEENLVRIMTMHKSKGLEFPAVVVAGLGKEHNQRDQRESLLLHKKLGIGVDMIDSERYQRYPSVLKSMVAEQLHSEMIAEEMRVLYVAMTRAQERLIMTGVRKEVEWPDSDTAKNWKMPADEAKNAKSYLEWIESIIRHKPETRIYYQVRTLAEEPEKEVQAPIALWQGEACEEAEFLLQKEAIEAAFSWEYTHAWRSHMPVRLSVSQLKKRKLSEMMEEKIEPDCEAYFVQEEPEQVRSQEMGTGAGGAQRGTAFHAVLAQADWSKLEKADTLQEELTRLQSQGLLTKEEKKLVDVRWIHTFVQSVLYQRMKRSKAIYREQPFMMSLSLKELAELDSKLANEAPEDKEQLMIQGIVDCYFQEEGAWVLVDYKTDREMDAAKVAGYSVQLALYARALEGATGLPVRERILYDVRNGKEIRC